MKLSWGMEKTEQLFIGQQNLNVIARLEINYIGHWNGVV